MAGSTFKAETYRFLRLQRPSDEELEAGAPYPAGSVHLPAWIDSEWCKQLVGEQLVTVRTKRGFSRLEWQKLRERNEALDCRIYARAAAWLSGADRWPASHWSDLEAEFGQLAEVSTARIPAVDAGAEAHSSTTSCCTFDHWQAATKDQALSLSLGGGRAARAARVRSAAMQASLPRTASGLIGQHEAQRPRDMRHCPQQNLTFA